MAQASCNICGGRTFVEGPNGRRTYNGGFPRCRQCGSLERHRQLRSVYAQLPPDFLAGLDVLQLSPDVGVDPTWFRSYEISDYHGENSLDLEHIDRPNARYDLVICNHVLEHVADDRRGFRELMRVAKPTGVVQITVPSPYKQAVTIDWGYPKPEAHGHYRGYGRDIVDMFRQAQPGVTLQKVEVLDGVTGKGGYVYFCSMDGGLRRKLKLSDGSKTTTSSH